MNIRNTDDIFPANPTMTIPRPEPQATRFIDIHIYNVSPEEDEEATSIEATLESISKENQLPPDEQMPDSKPINPLRRKLSPFLLVCIGVLLLVVLGMTCLYILPVMTPAMTITIVPVKREVSAAITLVMGQQGNAATQIAGRQLPQITMSEQKTVATTGTTQQDAQAAHGILTFYNASIVQQVIPAGQLIMGADGVHIVTEQDAVIPAGMLATNGQVSVQAHAVIVGTNGNIAARDIYGSCCRDNVFVQNDTAFTGGQAARSYQTATPQDIAGTATSIKSSLAQSIQAAFQTQVASGEALLTPLNCQSQASSDHQPGEEAAQVTVTVNQICTAFAYQATALHDIMAHTLMQQAATLGSSFAAEGDIQIRIITAAQADGQGAETLKVQATQTYGYQFTQQTLKELAARIAGKTPQQVTQFLLHTTGVQQVSMGSADSPLPSNPQKIRFLLLQ